MKLTLMPRAIINKYILIFQCKHHHALNNCISSVEYLLSSVYKPKHIAIRLEDTQKTYVQNRHTTIKTKCVHFNVLDTYGNTCINKYLIYPRSSTVLKMYST